MAAVVVGVLLLTGGDDPAPRVTTQGNPFFPARGPLIGDRAMLRDAASAWSDADREQPVEALWAARNVVVLGQGTRGALLRRTGGDWKVTAQAGRVSTAAPLTFGGRGVLLPGNSGTRIVSTAPSQEVGLAPARLVDGMVLPASADQPVPPGFVPPDRAYGVITAFGQDTAGSGTVSYKVGGADDERIARLVRARHARALYEALYPGDRPIAGGGSGIGTARVLAGGRFGSLGYGVAVAHSRNSPANTAVSVGFDDEDRAAVLLGTGEPPFAADERPLFGVDAPSGGPGPLLVAGDPRIRRYEVYRGASRTTVPGPIAVLRRAPGVTAVIGRTAAGAPVLPVGE